MQIANKSGNTTHDGKVIRLRDSVIKPAEAVVIMLHGWTGDETSMGIFTPKLPAYFSIIAPRGWYDIPEHGFGWVDINQSKENLFNNYHQIAISLHKWLQSLLYFKGLTNIPVHLAGFSQGGILVYLLMLLYPELYDTAACLASALPTEAEKWITPHSIANKRFFISHGILDKIVPIEKARRSAELLKYAGADVIFCEEETGHKISLMCAKNLNNFLTGESN